MADKDLVKLIAVAVEFAGSVERGVLDNNDEDLLDVMNARYLPEDRQEECRMLANAFINFSQDVRTAERKKKPVFPHAKERDFPG